MVSMQIVTTYIARHNKVYKYNIPIYYYLSTKFDDISYYVRDVMGFLMMLWIFVNMY